MTTGLETILLFSVVLILAIGLLLISLLGLSLILAIGSALIFMMDGVKRLVVALATRRATATMTVWATILTAIATVSCLIFSPISAEIETSV
ncbi:MAG: hypothetical protein K8963_11275 [Proteobacteria bacterium]|nr:hypothetical protein [Pseudomonadota bacterium]